jgi:hypothetical protein
VLLPQPEPGTVVKPGLVTIEARGRGEAPIREIRLQVNGNAVATQLDQRSESIWRGVGSISLAAGTHTVRATVIDERGQSGAYSWTFIVR